MTADDLVLVANNDKRAYDAITFAVRHLRRTIDRVASDLAKSNAAWHDDPSASDHKAHHAPASAQFRRQTRDKAIKKLVRYYLKEYSLQDKAVRNAASLT